MSSETLKEKWKQIDITKEDVLNVLTIANTLLKEAKKDSSKCDYLGSHKSNREFRRINNLNTKCIYELASKTDLYDFCHFEKDSKKPDEKLYCFKLKLFLSNDIGEDVLYKFKLRKQENGTQTFVMSFHYPDENKEPWVHLWKM